jgi:hypothetical protein
MRLADIINLILLGESIWSPSKESIALSAELESILDVFLSPPKRFQLMKILHVTSALGGNQSKIIKSISRYFIKFSVFSHSKHNFKSEFH